MINENKIERAAQEHDPINDMLGEEARASFKYGVEWFKKTLWHTDDEIPEADRIILVKGWTSRATLMDFSLFNTTVDLDLADFDRKIQWKSFCEHTDVDFAWCYIDDLLPKGGGK